MCLRKMSYVERMKRIIDYREVHRNRPRRTGARIVSTPGIARTTAQQQRLTQLTDELDQYKMKPEHTLCEHIKIVNQMIQELIHFCKSMSENAKKLAFYSTLPLKDGHRYLRL